MYKDKDKEPTRIITFGNFKWVHWLTVIFFLTSGILITIFPSVFIGKLIIGTIIIGLILISIGIFCIIDQIVYIYRMKKWKQK